MAANVSPTEAVIIDEGTFKYVLIKVRGAPSNVSKNDDCMYVVRGHRRGEYHADIFEEFEDKFKRTSKLRVECVGGGRIKHDAAKKHITVYGYSQGYGQAKHSISCEVLKTKYPDYIIDWNNEGY